MTDNRTPEIPDNVDPGFTGTRMGEFFESVSRDVVDHFALAEPEPAASEGWLPEGVEAPAEDEVTPRDVVDPEIEKAREELQEPAGDDEKVDEHEHWAEPSEVGYEAYSAAEQPAAQLLVIGSADWEDDFTVQAAVSGWINRHMGHRVIVATTGCPTGAEMIAAQLAQQMGAQVALVRSEQLVPGLFHAGLAFIRNGSAGVELVLERAAATGLGIKVHRVDEIAPKGAWIGY